MTTIHIDNIKNDYFKIKKYVDYLNKTNEHYEYKLSAFLNYAPMPIKEYTSILEITAKDLANLNTFYEKDICSVLTESEIAETLDRYCLKNFPGVNVPTLKLVQEVADNASKSVEQVMQFLTDRVLLDLICNREQNFKKQLSSEKIEDLSSGSDYCADVLSIVGNNLFIDLCKQVKIVTLFSDELTKERIFMSINGEGDIESKYDFSKEENKNKLAKHLSKNSFEEIFGIDDIFYYIEVFSNGEVFFATPYASEDDCIDPKTIEQIRTSSEKQYPFITLEFQPCEQSSFEKIEVSETGKLSVEIQNREFKEKFTHLLNKHGVKQSFVAKKLDMDPPQFNKKIKNDTFTRVELLRIKFILNLSNDEFCSIF